MSALLVADWDEWDEWPAGSLRSLHSIHSIQRSVAIESGAAPIRSVTVPRAAHVPDARGTVTLRIGAPPTKKKLPYVVGHTM